MKKLLSLIVFAALFTACETSEGLKFGTIQKVSHKTFPCDYYSMQVAYEGGVVKQSGESASFSNTEDLKLTKEAFDTLKNYVGERVVFDYKDDGIAICGSSKFLTSIAIKK